MSSRRLRVIDPGQTLHRAVSPLTSAYRKSRSGERTIEDPSHKAVIKCAGDLIFLDAYRR